MHCLHGTKLFFELCNSLKDNNHINLWLSLILQLSVFEKSSKLKWSEIMFITKVIHKRWVSSLWIRTKIYPPFSVPNISTFSELYLWPLLVKAFVSITFFNLKKNWFSRNFSNIDNLLKVPIVFSFRITKIQSELMLLNHRLEYIYLLGVVLKNSCLASNRKVKTGEPNQKLIYGFVDSVE